jgi:hypothetical protein
VVVMVRNQNLQLSKHLIYRRFSAFSKYFSIFYVVLTVFLSQLSVCFRIMLHKIMCVLQINFIITMSHMKAKKINYEKTSTFNKQYCVYLCSHFNLKFRVFQCVIFRMLLTEFFSEPAVSFVSVLHSKV